MKHFLIASGVTFAFICWAGVLAKLFGYAIALSDAGHGFLGFLLFAALFSSVVGSVLAFGKYVAGRIPL